MSPRRLAGLLLLVPLLGACATKRDLRDLRDEVVALRAAQDSTLRELMREQRRQHSMLDSLSDQQVRTRGDISNRFLQIDRQLVQIQELTGQGQQRLSELREQLNARQQEIARQADSAARADTARSAPSEAATGSGAGADELYNTSLAALRRGSLQTARAGFQEFLRTSPQHRLAPDALFYVGETYNEARDVDQALLVYAQVVQRYPASSRAPTALYRAGTVEAGRGNRTQARTLLNRVVQAYPRSPEAALARDQLQKLGRG
ncbi:MAG: tol-pal system protein YbgF [Gemmatimonadetes bacterium]|nr:tol-pal system protein YbgF [Gemmatimonadota bacterium]